MSPLFHAHSGLRFLVLLSAVVAIGICAVGLMQKKEFSKLARISCSVFIGTLHTQVLLGIIMVAMGTWYPKLMGHLVMMLLAAVLAQVLIIKNKKSSKPGYALPLIAIGGALLLIVGGIFAIGRSPFFSTTMANHVG
jgi:predicted AlkP superfamily pyrophosphatase or phosphodiesterase